jgi:hypothetical protein
MLAVREKLYRLLGKETAPLGQLYNPAYDKELYNTVGGTHPFHVFTRIADVLQRDILL